MATSISITHPGHWRAKNHYRSFVYRPYYYPNYNTPYFTSRYISNNDRIYDPTARYTRQINLNDSTTIEGFNTNNSWFLLLILVICIGYIIYKKI